MIGVIVLFGVILLVLLLLSLPLGVLIRYDGGLQIIGRIGFFSLSLYPGEQEKKRRKGKPEKQEPHPQKASSIIKQKQKPTMEQIMFLLERVPSVLKKASKRLLRHITIKPLHLTLHYGEEDPADAAIHFGKLYGSVAVAVETLDHLLTIKDKKVELALDFDRETPEICGEIGISVRIYVLLCLTLSLAADGWLLYKGYQKLTPREQVKKG